MSSTYKITVQGQVQGVGFRPFIFGLAQKYSLKGKVFNNEEGVIIIINASEEILDQFVSEILTNPPVVAIILTHSVEKIGTKKFNDFKIRRSSKDNPINIPLTPDFAICKDCKSEIQDPENRRYNYPFTTCVNCGPRYAITTKFPFERSNTAVAFFEMCQLCKNEYANPSDRRFHSQTNSCPKCGIKLSLVKNKSEILELDQNKIFDKITALISEGNIIAIKNMNGYLLCCDAKNETVIKRLRDRKKRPNKPFALMFPSIQRVKDQFEVSQQEEASLLSQVAPIVILKLKKGEIDLATSIIAPNLDQLGIMLPSSALLQLLLNKINSPIIATSGNIHGSPIISENKEAAEKLKDVADYFLHHNLDIQFPQDDSVIKWAGEQQIILRRSRGMAPNYIGINSKNENSILAMGAHLKGTFSYMPNNHLYVSQYFGNLDNYDVSTRYLKTITHFVDMFETTPNITLTDKHPEYQSTLKGKELASEGNAKLYEIQHHKAHFASVLEEHNFFSLKEKILGVIWDGTGLGDDAAIWGGEFFVYENTQIKRLNHFSYFSWIAADKMSKEPRISLLSLMKDETNEFVRSKFSETEWNIYNRLISKNLLKTSSVGRLFDAVASALGLINHATFEGEAAMLLENCAENYKEQKFINFLEGEEYDLIPSKRIIQKIFQAKSEGISKERISASFIYSLAQVIIKEAIKNDIRIIACSGGVFQNSVLVTHLNALTHNSDFRLKFNCKLSSNDENISFGQLSYFLNVKT